MTAASHNHDPVTHVVDTLRGYGSRVTKASGGWIAQCPAHDDRTPSLSISTGQDGRALLCCHAGCGIRDILDTIDIDPQALFADYNPDRARGVTHLNHVRAWKEKRQPPPKPPNPTTRVKTDHWDYHHPDGSLAARVVRYDQVDKLTGEVVGKTFTQHSARPDGTLAGNLGGMDVPIYNAPNVAAAIANNGPIFICEGERDADTCISLGITATTCAAGAGSWRPHHTAMLTGAEHVGIIADDDPPGKAHATQVAAELATIGVTARIYLPKAGNDFTDHVTAGYGIRDLLDLDAATEQERVNADTRAQFPTLDWHALWADETEEEWIIEPLLPARRLVALYSAPKLGKSLLMLEIAVAVSRGETVLGATPPKPYMVLYVDFENDPKSDIRSRLQSMGYGPNDLGNLHYLSFPTLAALDSAAGADQLLAAIAAYQAEVVVVDTVSRAIKGEENDNDTWLNFYRHTGLALKQAQIALIRLDHSGKEETKGQRGGSAKSGDVDAVWRLSKVTDTCFQLECEANRLPITEKQLTIHRETSPKLRHRVDALGAAALHRIKVDDFVAWLDDNGVPDDASNETVRAFKNERGRTAGNDVIAEVVRARKARIPAWTPTP